MKTRFDLEQQMLDTWKITDDLKLINAKMLDEGLSTDDVSNMLVGLYTLYNLKFEDMFGTFESLLKANVLTKDREFDFTAIPKLQEGEQLIFHVEVGDLSSKQTNDYMVSVKEAFEKVTADQGNHYIFAPMRHGEKTVEVEWNN